LRDADIAEHSYPSRISPVLAAPCGGRVGSWAALGFAVYCLMGITDYFDGCWPGRKAHPRLGVFLDPIADKIMVPP
jgi:CDP-diacylglycerol--glycerol-3-phosphate 3-phosphatidyltransferase/cardiolipin synthase